MNTPKETQTPQYAETFGCIIIRTATHCPTGGHPLRSAIVRITMGDDEEQLSPGQAMEFAGMIMSAGRLAAEWKSLTPRARCGTALSTAPLGPSLVRP